MMFRRTALTLGLVLAAVLVPAGAASADPPWQVPDDATITIDGLGFGHGRGLSQYGALGRGRAGQAYGGIVDFYYPGTTWSKAAGSVRVLVSQDTTTDVVVDARPRLTVRALGARRVTLPTALSGRRVTRWRILPVSGGRSAVAALTDRWTTWTVLGGDAEFAAGGRPLTLRTPAGAVAYRGAVRSATPSGQPAERDTVNVIGFDGYLRGVLPREVIASVWPVETLRAQAVAARTYAAFERAHVPAGRHYDVCDTTSCQVYGGAGAEHPRTDEAVAATAGEILTSGGQPAFTQFSASNGGWSVAGPTTQPYLVARADPFDHYDPDGVGGDGWRTTVTSADVERAFNLTNLTGLAVETRNGQGQWGGRAVSVRLTSSTGWTGTVSGDSFRRSLGLRSTYFTLADVAAR